MSSNKPKLKYTAEEMTAEAARILGWHRPARFIDKATGKNSHWYWFDGNNTEICLVDEFSPSTKIDQAIDVGIKSGLTISFAMNIHEQYMLMIAKNDGTKISETYHDEKYECANQIMLTIMEMRNG